MDTPQAVLWGLAATIAVPQVTSPLGAQKGHPFPYVTAITQPIPTGIRGGKGVPLCLKGTYRAPQLPVHCASVWMSEPEVCHL
jgi:hypothetical protein